jgi:hypothetical protein
MALTSQLDLFPVDGSKVSGEQKAPEPVYKEYLEKGKKYDSGKAPVSQGLFQYFPKALKAIAEVSKYGKDKYKLSYDDVNWARVEEGFERYLDGLGRHLLGHYSDGPIDPESGHAHLAHAAWNALAVLELSIRENEKKNNGHEAT